MVEARVLLEAALARARAAELSAAWVRPAGNLAVLLERSEHYADMLALIEEMEAQARQRGDRENLAAARVGLIAALAGLGRWQEALARAAEADELQASPWARAEVIAAVSILCEQGRLDAAQALLQEQEWQRHGEQAEMAAYFAGLEARRPSARDRPTEALAAAERGLIHRDKLGDAEKGIKHCLAEALEAALTLDELGKADELLATIETLQPGQLTPTLEGQCARFRARLDARRGDHATWSPTTTPPYGPSPSTGSSSIAPLLRPNTPSGSPAKADPVTQIRFWRRRAKRSKASKPRPGSNDSS